VIRQHIIIIITATVLHSASSNMQMIHISYCNWRIWKKRKQSTHEHQSKTKEMIVLQKWSTTIPIPTIIPYLEFVIGQSFNLPKSQMTHSPLSELALKQHFQHRYW